MSMLFAAAGGLIDAQDEAVAVALGSAVGPAPQLESLSIGSLTSLVDMLPSDSVGGYSQVGPEDVSGALFEQIKAGAEALQPEQFEAAETQLRATATALSEGAGELTRALSNVLGSDWQGEFAQQAGYSVGKFTESATALANSLNAAADKANTVVRGYSVTKSRIGLTSSTSGAEYGPGLEEADTAMARAVVNTEYNPAIMDANLTGLDFPTAYRVVASSALGRDGGVDPVSAWNTDGRIQPAAPAPIATQVATNGSATNGSDGSIPAGTGVAAGAHVTAASVSSPIDATTQAALLDPDGTRDGASNASGVPVGVASGAGGGAHAGGTNAGTTPAAAPLVTSGTGAGGPNTGGRVIGRGAPTDRRGRRTQQGFGSAAGAVGGGAAAAGIGAGTYGGAGTLAGHGSGSSGAVGKGLPGGFGAGGTAPAGGLMSGGSASSGHGSGMRGAMMPGAMMAAGAGQGREGKNGHTPAGYLVNATNTNAIIGDPPRASPAVLGRVPQGPEETSSRS